MVPGPTRYAVSHVEDIEPSFELFMTPSIENIVLRMTNLEGTCVWGQLERLGLLILARVYQSNVEATASLWNAETERWVQCLPLLYNPGPHVTVDECLVAFCGCCLFQQYMASKPEKYVCNEHTADLSTFQHTLFGC